jgi:hypothetical protein
MRLQVEEIFPRPKPERKKVSVEQVKEVLLEEEEEKREYDLSWLREHEVKAGRPAGAKDSKPRVLSRKEFWEEARRDGFPLHKETDSRRLALEIRERIKKGNFKIRTLTEFIAYLYAFSEFEDVLEIAFSCTLFPKSFLS